MRPALQRLLKRPSSLDFLQCLFGVPATCNPGNSRSQKNHRHWHTVASIVQAEELDFRGNQTPNTSLNTTLSTPEALLKNLELSLTVEGSKAPRRKIGRWEEVEIRDFDYESNLEEFGIARPKLLHNRKHRKNTLLWLSLLQYRERIHGSKGVYMYWRAVKDGRFDLPTTHFAKDIWMIFLRLGFTDGDILRDICDHADHILDSTGKAWPHLYTSILRHMLLHDYSLEDIKYWHKRLIKHHSPSTTGFAAMCYQVTSRRGNMEGLQWIYTRNRFGNIYSEIVPTLCAHENFQGAYDWHRLLISKGDLPKNIHHVEPLIVHFTMYDQQKALAVAQSLRKAGVSFTSTLDVTMNEKNKVVRTMVDVVHGSKFGIQPKEYNDTLGARWFATTWVSLDIAINAIGALGVEQIGPLSLQAMALREPDSDSVTRRIHQLKDIGISIGKSVFSKAVETFARKGQHEYLTGLLTSDQHPDALEDRSLQDQLMASFARSNDWAQYRRTLAIRFIGSQSPQFEYHNIILKSLIATGDHSGVLLKLRKMQLAGQVVTAATIRDILAFVLKHRRIGRRPQRQDTRTKRGLEKDDLNMAVQILKDIMVSGNYVPITLWREILKRLGMLYRMYDLEVVCEFLASWYGPANNLAVSKGDHARRWHKNRVSNSIPTNHAMHPLRILFGPQMQGAIVEWGFMHAIERTKEASKLTSGLKILQKINRYGVYIYPSAVRRALINRLICYYGAGLSNRRRNRFHRNINPFTLTNMVKEINTLFGKPLFSHKYLYHKLVTSAGVRIHKRDLKRKRLESTFGRSSCLSAWHIRDITMELHAMPKTMLIQSPTDCQLTTSDQVVFTPQQKPKLISE
jgi:hypothetical protein